MHKLSGVNGAVNSETPKPEDIPGFDAAMRGLVGVRPDELGVPSARDQTKAVIREIVRLDGGRLSGKTRLYKMFYFAHLFYAKSHVEHLTDWPIVRMPHGPGIDGGDAILQELEEEKAIEIRDTSVGPYPSVEFRSTATGIPHGLSLESIDAIRQAVNFAKDKSAAELSELTHEYSHSWRNAQDGEDLDFYVDLLSASEYEERKASMAETAHALRAVW